MCIKNQHTLLFFSRSFYVETTKMLDK